MKKHFLILLLTAITISKSFAQNNSLNKISTMTYQNVKTESVDVNGTKFFYRKLGENNSGIPIIFLNHLAATMDNCDPRIMDGLATEHQIICFDNRGVGATKGKTPKTIAEMATDARAFIHALGFAKVDLVGFSLGGFISQEILLQEPQLVRKAVIAGTGPAGGEGIKNVTRITYLDIMRGLFSFKDAKTFLFFNRNANGKKSAKEFLSRLKERTENRDEKMPIGNFQRQLKAIHAWGLQAPQDLSVIKIPVLVANGDNDRMVPSSNTYALQKRIANSEIIVYKDAGHGGIFQYHDDFVKSVLTFISK
jgi:pimeloyl-ACP methyl ester carboxylesterase